MVVELPIIIMFSAATLALILTPGPIVSLIIAETLTFGPRHGLAVLAGAVTVSALFLTVYVAGAAPLMMAMPIWGYALIRYAGAAFLLYLSWGMLRPTVPSNHAPEALTVEPTPWLAYKKSLLASVTNPKAILFFAAFFPQFIDRDQAIVPQLVFLSLLFLLLGIIGDGCWVFFAAKARGWLHCKGGKRLIEKIAGAALGLGAVLLLFINT